MSERTIYLRYLYFLLLFQAPVNQIQFFQQNYYDITRVPRNGYTFMITLLRYVYNLSALHEVCIGSNWMVAIRQLVIVWNNGEKIYNRPFPITSDVSSSWVFRANTNVSAEYIINYQVCKKWISQSFTKFGALNDSLWINATCQVKSSYKHSFR